VTEAEHIHPPICLFVEWPLVLKSLTLCLLLMKRSSFFRFFSINAHLLNFSGQLVQLLATF